MNDKQLEYIKYFLNECGVVMDTYNDLNGMLIPREILLSIENYKKVKDEILVLKKLFNSSALTALQSTAEENQKWPLLNLVRQILKAIHYKMAPKRVSAGYTKDGKKIYCRMFIVEKLSQTDLVYCTTQVWLKNQSFSWYSTTQKLNELLNEKDRQYE